MTVPHLFEPPGPVLPVLAQPVPEVPALAAPEVPAPEAPDLDAASALGHLRASARLAVAREGVPVLLGLVWESDAPPPRPSPGPDAVADGAVLQRALASTWAALASSQREDDLACLGSVVHAVAHADHAARGLGALGASPAAAARVPDQVRRRAVAPG